MSDGLTPTHRHLDVWAAGGLDLGGEGKGLKAEGPKQAAHLLPVGCEGVPADETAHSIKTVQ